MKHIEEKLKDGFKLHAFRSGGGLRVVTLKKEETNFYGESCNLSEALRILNDDVKAGGRKYKSVYGPIETPYLTGSYASDEDPVDAWVCSGRNFDIHFENDQFIIDMTEKEDVRTPQMILDRVWKNLETVYWKLPKNKRIFKSYPERIPNGEIACMTGSIPSRSGKEANDERIEFKRIATGENLATALENAILKVNEKFSPEWYEIPTPIGEMEEAKDQLHKL